MSQGKFVSTLGSRTAAVDTSVSAYFKQLDKMFPHSAFILTFRKDVDAWERSCVKHFNDSRKKIEGKENIRKILFENRTFKESFCKHQSAVLEYFGKESKRLLVIDVTDKTGAVNIQIFQFLVSWKKYLTQSKVRLSGLLKLSLENMAAKPCVFPHIRFNDAYRCQSTCIVRSRKDGNKILFLAGYVRKILHDDTISCRKRYAVFKGKEVSVYRSATLEKSTHKKYICESVFLNTTSLECQIIYRREGSDLMHSRRFVLFGLINVL